jgi:hypothetical protein
MSLPSVGDLTRYHEGPRCTLPSSDVSKLYLSGEMSILVSSVLRVIVSMAGALLSCYGRSLRRCYAPRDQ